MVDERDDRDDRDDRRGPDENRAHRRVSEEQLRERGLYHLPDVPEEPGADNEPIEFDWRDVIAFVLASYQIIFPFLGVVVVIFLIVWGILWLMAL